MKIITKDTKVFGVNATLDLMEFDKDDGKNWKILFDKWLELKMGMRDFKAREPNFPEGLSEVAFCLFSGSYRIIKIRKARGLVSSSFDTFNTKTGRAEQIKATSVAQDLTSFGPKSKWDDIYLLDFYNNGKLNGTFNVYKIPNELISNMKVNAVSRFVDQQGEKRRPRFSMIKNIIIPNKIKPLATDVKVW